MIEQRLGRNPQIATLQTCYLFPRIQKSIDDYLQQHPAAKLINLGIGDTTHPITPYITQQLVKAARELGTPEGYSGYGPDQGLLELRQHIAKRLYDGLVDPEDIFVSDGAKCDVGRLQYLFGPNTTIAVQNPTYPVYVDTNIISGKSSDVHYMSCTPDNHFFSDLSHMPTTDLIYFCSPNNPTGCAASEQQLQTLVDTARQRGSLIIFDAAYSCFIQDQQLPRSIYQIKGARDVAIEIGSFSKMAGFTGLRLGWSIVPKELRFKEGTPIHRDWTRITTTFFNGASNIAQKGGIAALEDEGFKEIQTVLDKYLTHANMIKHALLECGLPTYGGDNSPYVWADFSPRTSWDAFHHLLDDAHIVSIPGSGFGSVGEGFLRFSAFAHRHAIEQAIPRLLNSRG